MFSAKIGDIVSKEEANSTLQVPIILENTGKILNSKANDISGSLTETETESKKAVAYLDIMKKTTSNAKRVKSDAQVFTGNIATDFSHPIAKGNFVVLKGEVNQGFYNFYDMI